MRLRTTNRGESCSGSVLTRVGLRAGTAVVTRGAVRLRWIRTSAGGRVARTDVVTLIRRGAHDRVDRMVGVGVTGVGRGVGRTLDTNGRIVRQSHPRKN